jgi:hypothetical protein
MTEPKTQAAHSGTCPSDCSACRVCDGPTSVVFNIGMRATPVCEGCANAITLQQVQDLVKQNSVLGRNDPPNSGGVNANLHRTKMAGDNVEGSG